MKTLKFKHNLDKSLSQGHCIVVFLLVSVLVLMSQTACRSDKGNSSSVVLYCSVDQEIAEPIIAHFEKIHGIEVLVRFDTEASKTVGLVQRLRAEASAPVCDVFWSSEVFYTIRLAREGLYQPYTSERTAQWPSQYRDPNGLWYGFGLRGRSIAYNTQRITLHQAPTSLEDLLDTKWDKRLVMARPEFGTTGGDVASWFVHYGEQRAKAILTGLKSNHMRLVSGNSTAVRQVAMGQADICLTDTDDVYAAQRNGWPVAMLPLNQAGAGALAIPNTAALIDKAPHEQAARVLMGYLLSDGVEEQLLKSDSRNSPVNASCAGASAYLLKDTLAIDYAHIADALPSAIKRAREILN
jgi:iron(III) transport system substrate-binding protein